MSGGTARVRLPGRSLAARAGPARPHAADLRHAAVRRLHQAIPSFEDDAEADRKLAIICSKGSLDMAYPGLILANAALGEGIETHVFFTFWGFDIINTKTLGELKFSPLGNPATHMPNLVMGLRGRPPSRRA